MAQSPSSTQSQLEQGWKTLRVDMNKLRSDLSEVAQALFEAGKSEAGEAKTRLQGMAQQRLDDVRKVLDTARERSRSATDVVKQQVEQKPMVSMLVALGAGILLGALIRRK